MKVPIFRGFFARIDRTLSKVPRGELTLLGGILFVAFAMRAWGTSFGLPHIYHPDEGFEVYRAIRLGTGEIDLDRIAKGGYYLILFLEYAAYFVWLLLTRAVTGLEGFATAFVTDPTPFWKMGRVTTALFGTATVFLVWWQGRRLGSSRAGLLGGWFLALSFQHVVDSHYITVDVPMALFAFATVFLVVEDASGRTRLKPWLFAPVAAFAILNKIPAALIFVPYFLGAFLRGGWGRGDGLVSWRTIFPVLLTIAFYAVANPGIVAGFGEFAKGAMGVIAGGAEEAGEYAGVEQRVNLWTFYSQALLRSQGPALLALALLGGWFGLIRRSQAAVLHLSFLVPFFVLIAGVSSAHFYYLRYIVPLLPGLCLLAGLALDDLVRRLDGPAFARHAVAVFTGLILVAEPGIANLHSNRRLSQTDTRTLAAEWLEGHVRHGTSVLLEGTTEDISQLLVPLRDTRENVNELIRRLAEEDPGKARFWEIKLETLRKPRYDLVTVRHFEPWGSLDEYRDAGVRFVVLRRDRFANQTRRSTRHAEEVISTRASFYRELTDSESTELAALFEASGRPGYDLEIWEISGESPTRLAGGR